MTAAESMGELQVSLAGRMGAFTLEVGFTAPAAGLTALVGPSGSGKSTLLRALAGLERLDGTVNLGGEVWQDGRVFVPAHRRAIGYVFQHAALLPHLSVAKNLAYGHRRTGGSASHFEDVVQLLSLSPLLDRSPGRLSGGERQRVALGRALLTRPRLLLLDEPLSGLDAAAKAELLPRLKQAIGGLAIPVIYVSHDHAEVTQLSDRVVAIDSGRLATSEQSAECSDPLWGLSPERVRELAAAALRAGLDADASLTAPQG